MTNQHLLIMSLSLAVILLAFCAYLLIQNFKLSREASDKHEKIKSLEFELFEAKSKSPTNPSDSELNVKYRQLKDENSRLRDQLARATQPEFSQDRSLIHQQVSTETSPHTSPLQNKKIYFPAPTNEGEFRDDHKSERVENESMYSFQIDGWEEDHANFSFFSSASSLEAALQHPDIYLKRACEYQNSFNRDAQRIETVSEGAASREGNLWRVKKKATIRFV